MNTPSIVLVPGEANCPTEISERIDIIIGESRDIFLFCINGSGSDVGKTRLTSLVGKHLCEKGVYLEVVSDDEDYAAAVRTIILRRTVDQNEACPGVVLRGDYEDMSAKDVDAVTKMRSGIDMQIERGRSSLRKVDLWLSIERPDRPFTGIPISDIRITNLGATDKKR